MSRKRIETWLPEPGHRMKTAWLSRDIRVTAKVRSCTAGI